MEEEGADAGHAATVVHHSGDVAGRDEGERLPRQPCPAPPGPEGTSAVPTGGNAHPGDRVGWAPKARPRLLDHHPEPCPWQGGVQSQVAQVKWLQGPVLLSTAQAGSGLPIGPSGATSQPAPVALRCGLGPWAPSAASGLPSSVPTNV